ncbi:metal-dependent hydrolase [Paenibacillus septentrionalis]|uniref:Metal-dependent hydrolase n=1 Tax=Paenibacillus septentrionalis TaxID=429342 RepID=A0ABW1VBC3_9BACL
MDSASHFVVGVGLAGLAQLDPVVHSNPALSTVVIIGTIIGSQAPDFDTITRLKNNETYIRQHRGISHSLPAIGMWTIILSTILYVFVAEPSHYMHLLGWIFLAVSLHVFMDLFNTYGTQALRPFSKKWISWNIIHIFDPFIFTTHVVAGLLWITGLVEPIVIFPTLYICLLIYYVIRIVYHRWIDRRISRQMSIPDEDTLTVMPTVRFSNWHLMLKRADGSYELGSYNGGNVSWHETVSSDQHPLIETSRAHPSVAALLDLSRHTVVNVTEHYWGTEVRWFDVRYRYRKQYPFVAIVFYDHDHKPIASYVGWLNDQKLYKRLYQQAKLSPS